MALVEHESHAGVCPESRCGDDLVHDPEKLERVRSTHHEVVIGVEATVEVKAAQLPGAEQHRDDELDIGAGSVMAGVDQHLRPLAEPDAMGKRRAPVGHIGAVESRLEELVLEQEPHPYRQGLVHGGESLGHAVLASGDAVLARVVRAVGKPQAEDRRTGRLCHLDALLQVPDRAPANRRIRVADATKLVLELLEHVGVDGADLDPDAPGVLSQVFVVVNPVPWDVDRHRRGNAGEAIDLGCIVDLLIGVACHPGLGEHLEPGARVPVRPRGRLDPLPPQDFSNRR